MIWGTNPDFGSTQPREQILIEYAKGELDLKTLSGFLAVAVLTDTGASAPVVVLRSVGGKP